MAPTIASAPAASNDGFSGSCPFCNVVFVDAADLVSHVETQHPDGGGGQRGRTESDQQQGSSCGLC